MAYDDTPLYEQNKIKPFPKILNIHKSGHSPSFIFTWWERESEKRMAGKYNEIDRNEMEQALKGVKNKWHSVVNNNKKLVETFLEALEGQRKNHDVAKTAWLELKQLKKSEGMVIK